MDTSKILGQASRMAASAKSGYCKIGNDKYLMQFDSVRWVYVVSLNGEFVMNINSKQLSDAKRFLKHYMAN